MGNFAMSSFLKCARCSPNIYEGDTLYTHDLAAEHKMTELDVSGGESIGNHGLGDHVSAPY